VPYVVATTISLLLSSHKGVQRTALVILIGFAVAYVSFHHAYISVWCFFAAVASMLVYWQVREAPAHRMSTSPL
jgi:Flp pilus assembly protein TadB